MAVVAAPPIFLNGAPDASIGTPEARSTAVPMMQIDLTDDVLEELLACTKTGKAPHIIFGRTPTLRYNGKTQVLDTTAERFRTEVYSHGSEAAEREDWAFAGLVSHSLAIQVARDATAGVDAALQTLKQNLAAASQEKELRGSESTDNLLTPLTRKGLSKKSQKQSFLRKSHLGSSSYSQPASPSFPALSPTSATGPTSASAMPLNLSPEDMLKRRQVLHYVAVKPRTENEVATSCGLKLSECSSFLRLCGAVGGPTVGTWKLHDKMYKELNIWRFRYGEVARQMVIENAIKAFDRLRLSRDDKLWQMLLPVRERGKGKVLSRLNFSQGPIEASRTPSMKPIDKKTGLPKKTGVKKAGKDEETKAQEKHHVGDGPLTKKGPKDTGSKMQEDGLMIKGKAKDTSNKNGNAEMEKKKPVASKDKLNVNNTSKTVHAAESKSPQEKPTKSVQGSKVKKQSTNVNGSAPPKQGSKPKNPSPLSASPPVNASDFEDDHPVHKVLSAAPSPAKSHGDKPAKRKTVGSDDSKNDKMAKRRKVEGEARPKPVVAESASLKRKVNDTIDVGGRSTSPTKKVKTKEDNNTPVHHRNLSSSSSLRPDNEPALTREFDHTTPPTSASPSPPGPLALSWRQTMAMSRNFKNYYTVYERLYSELASAPNPPTAERRAELMKMHNKLEQMKLEIGQSAQRH